MEKSVLWLLIGVGSTIGGLIPALWHAGFMSLWGIVGAMVGAFVGIYIYRRLDI